MSAATSPGAPTAGSPAPVAAAGRQPRVPGDLWAVWGVGLLLAYLVLVPLALVLLSSVRPSGFPLDPGVTGANFVAVYGDPGLPRLLLNTALFAAGSTALALVLGALLAWVIERTDMPGAGLFRALVVLPMATPPILLAIGWTGLLSPRIGVVNRVLQSLLGLPAAPFDVFGLGGMVFVEGLSLVPTAVLILSPAFRNLDPSLEEAAMTSGAGTGMLLRRVVAPLLLPAILAAAAFMLIVSLVVFDVPGTLGLPVRVFVLSTQVFAWVNESPTGVPQYGKVGALACLFLLLLLLLGWAYHWLTRRAQAFRTVGGKAFRARRIPLGPWRWAALAGVVAYFLVAVAMPLGMLGWSSLMPYQAAPSWAALRLLTLDNHWDFLGSERALEAAGHSALIAAVSATAVAALSGLVSWLVVRRQAPGRGVLDALAFAPVAVPGVMIGVALIYVYLTLGAAVPVYGTVWIIAIAYVTQYLPFGTRLANGVMIQLHPELEEAGRASGAGEWRVLRRVTLPLALPALAAVWTWVMAHALRELSSALMLQGQENGTVTTLLWDYWSGGEPTRAASVGVWLVGAVLVVLVVQRLVGAGWRRPRGAGAA